MTALSVKSTAPAKESKPSGAVRWSFAQAHPIWSYLLITFVWSWMIWFATIPLPDQQKPLMALLTMVGAYGPAAGAILTLGFRNGFSLKPTLRQGLVLALAAIAIFALFALRALTGSEHYDGLPESVALTGPVLAAALLTCVVGGWVISNARTANTDIREKMASIFPTRLPLGWNLFALLFFPTLILLSWGLAAALGMEVEFPAVWERSAPEVIGLFVLAFLITAVVGGGLEEPGWRGMLLPELQKKHTPLVTSLIIAVVWSLWHLPLYLNGFYSGDLVGGMLGGFIYRILLAIFLTWVYNRTKGNLFWLIYLHTSFNMLVNFLPVSDLIMLGLWLVVVVAVVLKDRMYRKLV